MDAADTAPAEALAALITAEDEYQAARDALARAEERRYAALWTAAQTVGDLATLKAASPATITRATIKAAARRFAAVVTGFFQPELW
jgi:hypothetical protein